ncbi:MAG: hypothetical protein ABI668_09940 [Sphingorhabdus sp.]
MFKWIYLLLLVSSVGFVFWKGRFDERLAAGALTAGSILTSLLYAQSAQNWLTPNTALLINEAAVTVVILYIAYRSNRFWPLPVAAFQITALLTPAAAMLGENLASYALGVTQGLWAYPQLLILVIATIRGQNASKASIMR